MQSKVFSTNKTLNIHGQLIDLSIPKVMGILNVTPDSFYDGGKSTDLKSILKRAEEMLRDGCTFVDIGGHSTRPGAEMISADEEIKRVLPPIKAIKKNFKDLIISIDTFHAEVANAAVLEGASIINDISGGQLDTSMFETASKLKVPYILTHSRGTPQTMGQLTSYDNLIKEMTDYYVEKIHRLHDLNVHDIIIDPGFGFAKTIEQNFEILKHLSFFQILTKPLLVGISRKSMIWKTLKSDPENSLNGTTALNTLALTKGASILRVHDVKEAMEVIKLFTFVS